MLRIIVNRKNKETLSSPGRFGFLTEPAQGVLLILNFTIDAIPPNLMRSEIESCILQHTDLRALEYLRDIENIERESIQNIFQWTQNNLTAT